MQFFPTCANMLRFQMPNLGTPARFFCLTCPYVCYLEKKAKIKKEHLLVKKEKDLIVSKDDELSKLPETSVNCPKCGYGKAVFSQQQTRSADEPMTIFYTCKGCKHNWTE